MHKPPFLWPSTATPPSEVQAIKDLNAHLLGVVFNVIAWEAGLQLYELGKQPPSDVRKDIARQWTFVAGHECVLQLYHLKARLQKIKSLKLRDCASIRTHIDASGLRTAIQALDDAFPNIDELRHAVAHAGANEMDPERHAPDGRFGLIGFREQDSFSAPYEGKLRHLELSRRTLGCISTIVDDYLQAFRKAEAVLESQGHLE